ncbi:MAG: proline--tRNA ligase [Dehalococcoidia bacterium]
MRLSQLFGKTLREEPADAETVSHKLLVKAGLIAPLTAGVYSILPLGLRAIRKIEGIIREEMDAAGGQELLMPALQPAEVWDESGRRGAFGDNLFQLRDRRDRAWVLAPTHEEVVTLLARQNVKSYRDLPLLLYQIRTKFRDELRPRAGLVRVREFDMKDLYSFDADEEGLDVSYQKMLQAYRNIFTRCGVPSLAVEADSGAIGGKDSHEFILLSESGEDLVVHCTSCDYAANQERAESVKSAGPEEAPLPLEPVDTPGAATIEEVSRFLGVPKAQTLKAVFYAIDGEVKLVMVRGDLEVNEVKLKNLTQAGEVRLASDAEVREAGLVAGAASPVGLEGIKVVADESITMGANFVVGANRPETHLRNANYPRDFQVDVVAEIANAEAGHGCPRCGRELRASRGIEVGHVFKLGTAFSTALGAFYLDRDGVQRPIVMGSYGIGLGRLLAAVVEQNHDERGIVWPASVAPFQAHLVVLGADRQAQVAQEAEGLYQDLRRQGVEVLYDDRAESPGVKFNDADLLGMPVRLTVSPRTVKESAVEVKRRSEAEATLVPAGEAVAAVRETPGVKFNDADLSR